MDWNNIEIILIALLALSEALALIPGIKSKSNFQLIWNTLKSIKEKLPEIKKVWEQAKELGKKLKNKDK